MKKQIEKTQTDSSFTKRLNNNFIGHIRTCFKLEAYYDKKNGYLQTICKIKKMCQNEYVKKIISESDSKYDNFSQKAFSFFVYKQKAVIVYLICKAQNAIKRIE